MKKAFASLVLLNLIFLLASPISAQDSRANTRTASGGKSSVTYVNAEAFSDGQGVLLRWETGFESKNLGFNIYRLGDGEKQTVNSSLISGALLQTRGDRTYGRDYTFFDAEGVVGSIYYIESYGLNGEKISTRQFSAQTIGESSAEVSELYRAYEKSASEAAPSAQESKLAAAPGTNENKTEGDAPTGDIVKQRFVAAQPGVRIGVKREGFYRVLRADLIAAGFDVNAPTALWQLYLNGVEQSIIVGANGDYVEFYGKGIDERDTDTQIYFLIVGTQNGKRIGNTLLRSLRDHKNISKNYPQSFIFKERNNYVAALFNGDANNFFGRILTGTETSIPLNLTGVDFTSADSSVDITLQGIFQSTHQTVVTLNNVELGTVSGFNYDSMTQHFDIPTSLLVEGANTLKLKTVGGTLDISRFDNVKVNYARQFLAVQNQLTFPTTATKTTFITGFSSLNVRVFDVTVPDSVKLNANAQPHIFNGVNRVKLPPFLANKTFFAVEDSAVQTVAAASITPNTTSMLFNGSHSADLVIISYKDWLPQATAWANYRAAQGLTVEVVNVEDIYDEFNFGAFSSDAVKDFLQHSLNNWQTRYALLLGDATYDPRNYTGDGVFNYVPTKLVETFYFEAASDEALADFNGDALGELAVGRIPAHSGADVTRAFNKISGFEQTVADGLRDRGVFFASDLPRGYDFLALSDRLAAQLPSDTPKFFLNKAAPNARAQLVSGMNEGRFIVNYSGHGSRLVWGDSNPPPPSEPGVFFNSGNAAQLTNGLDKLSIFSLLTCLNGQFTNPTDSMSEILLKNQNGGAAAVWSSTGDTTPDIQEIMAARFYNQIAAGNLLRIGDLTRDAKTVIPGGRDVRWTWALLGDPAMKVR